MAVTQLVIRSRTPLAGGAPFGDAGGYQRLDGVVHFAVDPRHPANRAIVGLDMAAPGPSGLVEFEADFCLVQPADPNKGNGRLLFDVLNRGRKLAVNMFNRCRYVAAPSRDIEPGDGFLFRRGWTLAWVGWQWDVIRDAVLMGLDAPQALGEDGQPLRGRLVSQFQPVDPDRDRLLADRIHHPYPTADVNDPEAEMAVREWPDGPRMVVPRDRWRFARDEGGNPVPDDARVWLEGGFEPGKVYDVVYRTRICPVVGTGLLAVRDAVSFLRCEAGTEGNPSAGQLRHTYGFGMSQSGRFLRHFLYLGLNLDEAGRQVFDGLHIHVAGARRGEFNQRYGQPSVQNVRNFGHLPPFATRELLPVAGVPRIIETNTGAEYWRGDCSLLHTGPHPALSHEGRGNSLGALSDDGRGNSLDALPDEGRGFLDGTRDVALPDDLRMYYFAGTQHVPGSMPAGTVGPDGARSANPGNVVDYSPLMRAALLNLDRWITEGAAPPPSQHPRLSDGTALPAAKALAVYRTIPGVAVPRDDRIPTMVRVDLGPEAERGIGRYPAETGEPYRTYVSGVDADGNETGGIRLPDLSVPLASYVGWNPRAPETGGAGQIISMQGSTFPFSATEELRAVDGDPRPSIAARYRDLDNYLTRVRAAAEALVGQGHLLTEDVSTEVELARERYRAWAAS